MFKISKEFEFCASHSLINLEEGHSCMRIHGHNYKVIIELQAEKLNKDGFVCDYRKFDPIKKMLDEQFDHRHLNDFLAFQPSAENIAKHIFEIVAVTFPQLQAVIVSETPKTFARYER